MATTMPLAYSEWRLCQGEVQPASRPGQAEILKPHWAEAWSFLKINLMIHLSLCNPYCWKIFPGFLYWSDKDKFKPICALPCTCNAIPSSWNTFPSFPHLVNAPFNLNPTSLFQGSFLELSQLCQSPVWHACRICTSLNCTVTDAILHLFLWLFE